MAQKEPYERQSKDLDVKVEGETLGQISKVMGGGQWEAKGSTGAEVKA